MDFSKEGELQFKHSLIISQRFSAFWQGYRRAVVLFYLIKGPVFLFSNKDFWKDDWFFYTTCAVSLSLLSVDILNMVMYLFVLMLTCCFSEKARFQALGLIYLLGLVSMFY
jgi:hypothetical protein